MWTQVAILLGVGLFVLTDDIVRKYAWIRWLGFGIVWCSILITILSLAGDLQNWGSGKLDSAEFLTLALVTTSIAVGAAFQAVAARTVDAVAQGVAICSIGITGLFVLAEAYVPAAVVGAVSICFLWLCSDKLSIRVQQKLDSRQQQNGQQTFSDRILRPYRFGDFYERFTSCAASMVLLYLLLNVLHFAVSIESHREIRKSDISTLPTQRTIDYVMRDNSTSDSPILMTSPIGESLEYFVVEIALLVVATVVGSICIVSKRRQLALEQSCGTQFENLESRPTEG